MEIKFPARYTFNLLRDTATGEQHVNASECREKSQLENIKYRSVRHFSWDGNKVVALLDVREIESEQEMIDTLLELGKKWDVKVLPSESTEPAQAEGGSF